MAEKLGPEDYARVLLPWMFTDNAYNAAPEAMESAVQQWVSNPNRPSPQILQAQSKAILSNDTSGQLDLIKIPTLVAVASGDALTPPTLSRILANGIADATYAEVDSGAHAFIVDAAPLVAEHLTIFLAKNPIASEQTTEQSK